MRYPYRYAILVLAALGAMAGRAGAQAASCDGAGGGTDRAAAKRAYDAAAAEKDPQKRATLLTQSLRAAPSFEASFQLGDTILGLPGGDVRRARTCFTMALANASSAAAKARASANIGESYRRLGCAQDQITWLKKSLAEYRYPQVEAALKAASEALGDDVRADEIRKRLTPCDPTDAGLKKAFGVEEAVDLRINFAYDRADLTDVGRKQAQELGRALSAPEFAGRAITLVGHTDQRGEDAYNDQLSRRRAETVKQVLTSEFRIPAAQLRTEGHGKRELMITGTTEQDYALNRRVEVRVALQ